MTPEQSQLLTETVAECERSAAHLNKSIRAAQALAGEMERYVLANALAAEGDTASDLHLRLNELKRCARLELAP